MRVERIALPCCIGALLLACAASQTDDRLEPQGLEPDGGDEGPAPAQGEEEPEVEVAPMKRLLEERPHSEEAAKVRPLYASTMAARLDAPEKIGPPTLEDPDPIATLLDDLERLAPEEPKTVEARTKAPAAREAWERRYQSEIAAIDEVLSEQMRESLDRVARIIRDRCAPRRAAAEAGDQAALVELRDAAAAAMEALPATMSEEELQQVGLMIEVNCIVAPGAP